MHNIFCFHIEPTRGCTRRCEFCGIQAIKNDVKKSQFMEMSLAKKIAKEIKNDFKEKIRIDFSLHGEPLQHPEIVEMIRVFRKQLPLAQLSVISNGDMIARGKVKTKDLFDAGLNYIMIDEYERPDEETANLYDDLEASEVAIFDYFKDKKSIWRFNSHKEQAVILVQDLAETSTVTRKIHTAGGNLDRKLWVELGIDESKFPFQRQCSKPFTELSINYDGNISVCCEDWARVGEVANVNEMKLIDIWTSKEMEKYRYILHNKRRDLIELCKFCDQVSFRTGLYKPEIEFPKLLKGK